MLFPVNSKLLHDFPPTLLFLRKKKKKKRVEKHEGLAQDLEHLLHESIAPFDNLPVKPGLKLLAVLTRVGSLHPLKETQVLWAVKSA